MALLQITSVGKNHHHNQQAHPMETHCSLSHGAATMTQTN